MADSKQSSDGPPSPSRISRDSPPSSSCVFPLDRPGLSFDRFEHILISPRDVVVFRIMKLVADWTKFEHLSHEDRDTILKPDIRLLNSLLLTSFSDAESLTGLDALFDLIQRHYFELDEPIFRNWLRETRPWLPQPWVSGVVVLEWRRSLPGTYAVLGYRSDVEKRKEFTPRTIQHLQSLQRKVENLQDNLHLHNGGSFAALSRQCLDRGWVQHMRGFLGISAEFASARFMHSVPHLLIEDGLPGYHVLQSPFRKPKDIKYPSWVFRVFKTKLSPTPRPDHRLQTRGPSSRRRAASEPDLRAFTTAGLPKDELLLQHEVVYPKLPLSKLYARSRSRSLSRSRIDEMFRQRLGGRPPTTQPADAHQSTRPDNPPRPPCQNCGDLAHKARECPSRCGFCGAPNPHFDRKDPQARAWLDQHANPHTAPRCPVAKSNRCKCVAFPQFHTADACPVVCSRDCGNQLLRGGPGHRNAMTCKSRCCMCGLRGHSGKQCRLRCCRCKGKHLGQDCGWNPVCRVPGCDRYLCGLHCRECGSDTKPFVARRCQQCLSRRGS